MGGKNVAELCFLQPNRVKVGAKNKGAKNAKNSQQYDFVLSFLGATREIYFTKMAIIVEFWPPASECILSITWNKIQMYHDDL